MSDTTNNNDGAIEVIDVQVRQLDEAIAASNRRLELDTAIRNSLLDLKAQLGRKPRAATRKPRVAGAAPEAAETAETPVTPPPTSPWPGFSVVSAAGAAGTEAAAG